MKLTILPEQFREALSVASGAVSTRQPNFPVLAHVLLEATPDGGLILSGTDTESRAWRTVSARVDEAGAVTLPPKALADFLDAVPDGEPIAVAVDGKHKADLVCGRTRVRLAGLDPEGFPPCPDFSDPAFDLTLGADVLAMLVRSVAHAFAPDDSRPELAGILFRATGNELLLVAADGYRLAMRSVEVDNLPELDVIALGKTIVKAAGVLGKATSARLLVDARRSMLLADTEAGCWAIRLLEGKFPDFRRIIPRDPPIAVTVDRADFARALRLVRNVEKTSDGFIVRLDVQTDSIGIRAGGTDGDQQAETMLACTLDRGTPLRISFNAHYLRDAVEAIEGERLTLEMVSHNSAVIARAVTPDGNVQVLMPMSVRGEPA